MKILYFDTETTGTDAKIHEITQFAAIIEIDGVVKEEVNFRCQPTRWESIDEQALRTTGITIGELKCFDPPTKMYEKIVQLLDKYVPKYSRMPDKFYPAGHNVQFDLDFFDAFVRQHGDAAIKKWGSVTWKNWRALDSRVLANYLMLEDKLNHQYGPLPDVKLATLCEHFKIPLNAHDALSDIRATRLLTKALRTQLSEVKP